MARLTAPNGSVVNVGDEFAKRLVAEQGFKADGEKKAAAKKAASKKPAPADSE